MNPELTNPELALGKFLQTFSGFDFKIVLTLVKLNIMELIISGINRKKPWSGRNVSHEAGAFGNQNSKKEESDK